MARKQKLDTEDLPKAKLTKDSLSTAFRVFSFGLEHRWKFFIGLFFLFLTGGTALLFPKLMGELVDMAKAHDLDKANYTALMLGIILIAQAGFSFFRIYLFVNYTEHTLASLRQVLYSHLIRLPMNFFSQRRVGELNSRISSDLVQIGDALTTTSAEFLRQIMLIIGGIIFLSITSIKLTLLMLAIFPVVMIAAVIFGRFIRKISKNVQDKIADSNTIVEETLQGIANVKAFANELFEIKRYKKSTVVIAENAIKGGVYRGVFASFIIFCLFGAIVAVVWYGVVLAIQGDLSIGELISFVLYSIFVGASFGGIAEMYAQLQKTVGATERLFELLDEEIEATQLDEKINTLQLRGDVSFKNIEFTYPSRKEMQIIKNVSFSAKSGETVAIVGPSGSGKSTMVALLLRFYDPERGSISID
jgi:ABC-type multidrug transport system fused ATPase/permease subunit